MSLRGPAAPLRKTQSWRRSGDDWDSLIPDTPVPHLVRGSRPQSAIEGGHLDNWLKHLQRIRTESPNQDQAAPFNDYTPLLDKESPCPTWKQKWGVPSSRGSSSGGSPSLCGSSQSSQESLQAGLPTPPERRDSWERARISQAPKKEQTRVSFLTPVKVGWLPIRRKVMMVGDQGRTADSGQVKLKQPITPTLLKNAPSAAKSCDEEEVERSHSGPGAAGVRTWQEAPDQGSSNVKQVPKKHSPAVSEGPVSWQALKRGWKLNRVLALPGGTTSNKNPTGTGVDHPQTKVPNVEQEKPNSLQRTTSADPSKDTVAYSKAPLHRTPSVQPIKALHIETTSAATTLIPENKAGFSSITISSRKVCRSASLPTPAQSMDTNPRQVMVQRKATIVKVTEQRVTSSPIHSSGGGSAKVGQNQPTGHAVDTVVHRRKATIIKVTEHRESFTPANANPGRKNSEYRHSYSEGFYKENSAWTQGNHAEYNNARQYTSPVDSKPIHRSTLSLIVATPHVVTAPPANSEVSSGAKSDRPQRPSSCYGNVFGGNSESIEERKVSKQVERKLSLGSTQVSGAGNPDVTGINGMRTRAQASNGDGTTEMTAPSLMLIKSPDPHQTPEEVLALNAAAIIANIKLQRQLSKKKTPNSKCEDSDSTPQHKTVTAVQDCVEADNCSARVHSREDAAFVPPSHDIQRSTPNISLQEALQRSRPHFISRSQRRLQELERKAQERRSRRRGTAHSTQPEVCNNHGTTRDDLSKPRDSAVAGKDMQLLSKRPTEVKMRKEEEAKRDVGLNNRQRAELFKKKLLDQVLQRSND